MSIETKTTHVSETELAERLTQILNQVADGERVVIERNGRDFAVIAPTTAAESATSRAEDAPANRESAFDDEFMRAAREFRESLNSPRVAEWPE